MRNPRYDRYGQMPHTTSAVSSSTRGGPTHNPTSNNNSGVNGKNPEVHVENTDRGSGRGNHHRMDMSGGSNNSRHHHYHGNHGSQGNHVTATASNHVQPTILSMDDTLIPPTASNPNRSDMPPKRKGSLDPVSYFRRTVTSVTTSPV